MVTHTYPSPQAPALESLPACGCPAPEWLDPANALCGCANCGRAIDPRLCCSGPPTSPHWAAWSTERSRLEVELVAAEVTLAEAERQRRIDQRRKDAGNERSIQRSIVKQRAAVAAGGVWDPKSYPGSRHKIADAEGVLGAVAQVQAIVAAIYALRAECQMCAAAWDRQQDRWRIASLADPEFVRASKLADEAQEAHERAHSTATYKAHVETDAARRLVLVLAVERARLAEAT